MVVMVWGEAIHDYWRRSEIAGIADGFADGVAGGVASGVAGVDGGAAGCGVASDAGGVVN